MALIAQAAQQVPLAGMLAQTVDPVRHSLLSKLKPGDRLEIPTSSGLDTQAVPVVVDGDTAEQLTRSLRETSVERMVTDDFLLLAADFSKPGVVRVELQRVADDYAFRADVPAGVLDNEQERALRDKSWERQVLNLNVLVHDLHGRYTSAKVVAVRAL